MPLKFGTETLQNVYNIVVTKLPSQVVLGIPWMRENNPCIDWQRAKVTFTDGIDLQAVPCTEKVTCPNPLILLAKQYICEFVKTGQKGWITLISDENCVQTGILATFVPNTIGNKSQ